MPAKKQFFTRSTAPEDRQAREEDIEAVVASHLPSRQVRATDVPIDRIRPNPFQARRQFSDLEDLAQAIRVQGFTSRLRVRRDPHDDGYFQLVYGERRLRAAKLAALPMLPVEVGDHSDDDLIEIGLAENIQRRDLDPLEEAQAFRTLIDERGYSIRRLAERIGKDKGYIENRLALLQTPEDVQQMVEQRPDSVRAAREIAKLATPDERRPFIEGIVAGKLTDRDVRTQIREVREGATRAPRGTHSEESHRAPSETGESQRGQMQASVSLEDDIRTVHAMVQRWYQALEHGQLSVAELAQAIVSLDTVLQPVRDLIRGEDRSG